jgi:hypothetical protein
MWVVVHMDMYRGEGGSCFDIFSGRLVTIYGPFHEEADALSFKELKDEEDLYAQEFEVKKLAAPGV